MIQDGVYDYIDFRNQTHSTFQKLYRINQRDYPETAAPLFFFGIRNIHSSILRGRIRKNKDAQKKRNHHRRCLILQKVT